MSTQQQSEREPFDAIRRDIAPLVSKLDTDVIIYSGPIYAPADRMIGDIIKKRKARDSALLLLATPGGSADSAFRIARSLTREYGTFTLFVDSICKSAGTLIALAARNDSYRPGAEARELNSIAR